MGEGRGGGGMEMEEGRERRKGGGGRRVGRQGEGIKYIVKFALQPLSHFPGSMV